MEEQAAKIIRDAVYAIVATSSYSELPWNSPISVTHDGELHFYWVSDKDSRHSHNIRLNPQISLIMTNDPKVLGGNETISIEGVAYEINDAEEIKKACQLQVARNPSIAIRAEELIGETPKRIYKAAAEKVWLTRKSRAGGYINVDRMEVDLIKLQEFIGQ